MAPMTSEQLRAWLCEMDSQAAEGLRRAQSEVVGRAMVSCHDLEVTRRTLLALGYVNLDDLVTAPAFRHPGVISSANTNTREFRHWSTAHNLALRCRSVASALTRILDAP